MIDWVPSRGVLVLAIMLLAAIPGQAARASDPSEQLPVAENVTCRWGDAGETDAKGAHQAAREFLGLVIDRNSNTAFDGMIAASRAAAPFDQFDADANHISTTALSGEVTLETIVIIDGVIEAPGFARCPEPADWGDGFLNVPVLPARTQAEVTLAVVGEWRFVVLVVKTADRDAPWQVGGARFSPYYGGVDRTYLGVYPNNDRPSPPFEAVPQR